MVPNGGADRPQHKEAKPVTYPDDTATWHIAQLRPNGLLMALRNLERQSVAHFAPTELRTERRGAKFVTRDVPAFPGYVFVQPSAASGGVMAVNSTRGITKLITLGQGPAIVPAGLIAALRIRFAPPDITPAPQFDQGDWVKILDGPFAEFVAQVEATPAAERVYLLIDLMGRATRVAVDARSLKRESS